MRAWTNFTRNVILGVSHADLLTKLLLISLRRYNTQSRAELLIGCHAATIEQIHVTGIITGGIAKLTNMICHPTSASLQSAQPLVGVGCFCIVDAYVLTMRYVTAPIRGAIVPAFLRFF